MTYPALLGSTSGSYAPGFGGNPPMAPGMTSQQPMMSPAPAMTAPQQGMPYAHGGRVKRGKMIAIHASPHELDALDHCQGKVERCPRSGFRSYSHIEELLKNPHILGNVYHHTREHHAAGGPIDPHAGMHGDSEVALIGPHTHRVFDHLSKAMGASEQDLRNPHDGHPQYFSLGNILGGLGGALGAMKGMASGVGNRLGGIGSSIRNFLPSAGGLSNRFSEIGRNAANTVGNFAGQAGTHAKNFYNSDLGQGIKNQALNMGKDYVANKLGQSQNPYLQTLGQGVNAAGDAYLSGQSPREALGQGVGAAGQQFGGGIGGAMQNLGQSIGQGHSPSQALQNTARGGYEGIGGMQGIQNMGMDALNNFRSGQAPGQALQNVARNTWEQHRPRRQTPGFINMEGEMPGMEAMNYG